VSAEIGRCKLFASDRMEFVTEGTDWLGRKCWRTYVGVASPNGELWFTLQGLAYSPPADWNELGLP
jgi:hypothetical protein